MKTLTKGQRIAVYQKPLTAEDREGFALLEKREIRANETGGFESWFVRFFSPMGGAEKQTVRRLVHSKHLIS